MAKSANNISIGNAGEYFVAGELERHGFSVAVPMSNVELFDILAFHRESHRQVAIQVKTSHGKKKEWTLTAKNENIMDSAIFYVFVLLNDMEAPSYHIVPSQVVAKTLKESHQLWLSTPGKKGQPHNDNDIRKFADPEDVYLNRWEQLNDMDVY